MTLYVMTPLQALVISILFDGETSCRKIQSELAARNVEMEMTLVYRLLGRMKLAGYVQGRYHQYQTSDGRTIRERHYAVDEFGLAQWKKIKDLFDTMSLPREDFQPVTYKEYYED